MNKTESWNAFLKQLIEKASVTRREKNSMFEGEQGPAELCLRIDSRKPLTPSKQIDRFSSFDQQNSLTSLFKLDLDEL